MQRNNLKLNLYAVGGLLALMTSMVLISGCASNSKPPEFSLPVTLMTVGRAASLDTSEFMAEVNNDASVMIHANTSGLLKKVFVHDGQHVSAGQALFTLEAGQQAAQARSLEAQAQSTSQESAVINESIKALQADRQSVLADLKFNQDQLNRYKNLLATNTVSKKDVEQYETTVSNLNSKLASVDANIASARARKNETTFNTARDKQNALSVKSNLGYYTIKAPFSGIVGEVTAKAGNYIDTSTELASITNNKNIEIESAVSVDYLSRIKPGGKLQVLDNNDTLLSNATIDFISPKVDKASQTVLIKANINNNKGLFLADEKLKARFIWKTDEAILVPFETVFRMAGQPFVYKAETKVVDNKTKLFAKMQAVELGAIRGNNYVILSGLKPGDLIVTGSIQKLQNNMPIQDAAEMSKQPQHP